MIEEINGVPCIVNPSPEEHRLLKLQAEWRIAGPSARAAIADSIARNPQWEIEIHGGELRRRTNGE